MKKNLRAVSIFSGCISACLALVIFAALIPKQNLYQLSNSQVTTIKSETKKIQSNYTFLALLFLSGSIPLSVMANLVASNRLPEIELEAEEYNKQRAIRKIRRQSELDTERELCNANRTVTVTAHEKNLESAFVDLAEASNWHYVSDDEEVKDSHIASLSTTDDQKKNSLM
jgi:hypothetical protein